MPGSYTVKNGFPTLIDYDAREVESTAYMRVKHCSLIYLKAGRYWVRLTVSITTSIESAYWDTDRTKCTRNVKAQSGLSGLLVSRLETFLKACSRINQDSHLSVFLGGSSSQIKNQENCDLQATFVKPSFDAKAYLREITLMIRHWDCRVLHTRTIGYRPWDVERLYFGAYLDSRRVFAHRFGSDRSRIDANLYHLQVLHLLQGIFGVSPVLGILIDDEEIATAFLCELPFKGRLSHFMTDVDRFGQSVTLERRMKWCKQVVQVVAEAQNKGLVIGTLHNTPDPPFGIDNDDNVMLFRLISRYFAFAPHQGGTLPPELSHLASTSCLIPAYPGSDIYHLGQLLWRIAIKKVLPTRSYFCRIAGCHMKYDVCTEPHADPIQLPLNKEQFPRYLIDIVDACRLEDPEKRPSALELLGMFPSFQDREESEVCTTAVPTFAIGGTCQDEEARFDEPERPQRSDAIPTRYIERVEDLEERYVLSLAGCDICGDLTAQLSFHCNTCSSGDYDLCPRCFSEGRHCLNQDHYLLEEGNGRSKSGYHSSVKQDGQRVVVES